MAPTHSGWGWSLMSSTTVHGHWSHTEHLAGVDFSDLLMNIPTHCSTIMDNNTALYATDGIKTIECIYEKGKIRPLRKSKSPNRDLRLLEDALSNPDITILAVDGLAGSGKTSTAVKYAIDNHLQNVDFKAKVSEPSVLIAKPYVNAGEEEYGFLPGDINEKFDPTVQNFIQYFNRNHMAGFDALRDSGQLEVLPLGFIRGRDLPDTVVIIDECQNTRELVTMATRKAKNSRIVFLGDTSPFQIDLPGNTPSQNGLSKLTELLTGAEYFQHIELKTVEHILRSSEARDIIRRLIKKHGKSTLDWKV